MAILFARGARDRRGGRASRSAGSRCRASSAPRLDSHRALSGRLAGDGRGRLRGGRRAARIRVPRRVRGRAGARLGAHPGQAHGRPCSTRAWPGWRRSRCSWRSGCWCSRASSATWRSRAPRSRWCWCSWRARWRPSSAPRSSRFTTAERVVLGWAGLRGAVPVVLATFPVIDDVDQLADVLQHRLLRRRHLDAAAGHHLRAARQAPGGHHDRAGAAAPAGRDRHDPPAGRRGRRVPGRAALRARRPPRARARPAARRAAVGDRPRRARRCCRAARRGSRPATACTWSCAARRHASMEQVVETWEAGPVGPPPVERGRSVGSAVFSSRPWDDERTATPRIQRRSRACPVREHLRTRRDRRGALVSLDRRPLRAHRAHARRRRHASRFRRTRGADWRARPTTPRGRGGRR